jgi:RNA polymerase sigma factor (sigma-70 family)
VAANAARAPSSGPDDHELMEQVQAGSTDAFEQLYDRYCRRAYRVARSVCEDDGRAEDAVQEAFVSIWRNRSTYRPERGTVAAWLLSSVHYRAIDVARSNAKHARRRAGENVIYLLRAPGNLADRVIARDSAVALQAQLRQLPQAQREVIALAYYGELTHAEIATQLGLPSGTVKGRMRLGLQKLRAEMDQPAKQTTSRSPSGDGAEAPSFLERASVERGKDHRAPPTPAPDDLDSGVSRRPH